jgi:hypothetical protein
MTRQHSQPDTAAGGDRQIGAAVHVEVGRHDALRVGSGPCRAHTAVIEVPLPIPVENLNTLEVVERVNEVLVAIAIHVRDGHATRIARGADLQRCPETAARQSERDIDHVAVGVGDDDVGKTVLVEVAGRNLERSAGLRDERRREARAALVEQDRNTVRVVVRDGDVDPAVTIEVRRRHAARARGRCVVGAFEL